MAQSAPATAQTIEAYVGETMDAARMGPVHWQVLALVASGYFFDVLDFTIFGALVPDLIKSGFVTQAQVPWIGSVTVAGLFVGTLGQGEFTDRFGRKAVYQFNLLLFGLATIIAALPPIPSIGFDPGLGWLLVFRFLAGVGLGAEQPLCFSYTAEYAPKNIRGRLTAFMQFLGGAWPWPVGVLLTLALRDSIGWRGMWIIIGIGALVIFVEAVLAEMRGADPPVQYLVGTPKGRLTRLEQDLLSQPWQDARPGVRAKLLPQDGELYVFAHSVNRVAKERAMRRRQLKWLWARLKQLSMMALSREELLMKLGAARAHAPAAWRLVVIAVAPEGVTFTYHLDRNRLRRVRRREGRYLLRTNLTEDDPAKLWNLYLLLVRVEEAFKNLKGDLAIRPIFHQDQARIEAHIFIAFLAYCLHATLARRLHALAP